MADKIQRTYLGSQASPVLWTSLASGTLTMNESGNDCTAINYDALEAAIQTAIDAASSIGGGNSLITKTTNGFITEFQGTLANTNAPALAVTSSTLKIVANTISITNVQDGAVGAAVTPSITTTVSAVVAVTGVDEVAVLDLQGSTTGTFDLVDIGNPSDPLNLVGIDIPTLVATGASYLQGIVDSTYIIAEVYIYRPTLTNGPGGTVVFTWTNGGSRPIYSTAGLYGVSNASGLDSGTPSYTVTTAGVAAITGVYQQDTLTFSTPPDHGQFDITLGGHTISPNTSGWNAGTIQSEFVSTLLVSGAVVTGDWTGYTITYNDGGTYGPYSASVSNYDSGSGNLRVESQPQEVFVQLTDSPTEGHVLISIDGGSDIPETFDAGPSGLATDTGWATSGTDLTTGITFTAPTNAANVTFTVAEDTGTPALLTKALGAEVVTVQDGTAPPPDAPSGLSATANGQHQIDLAWTDNSSNETGFEVERSANGTTGWTLITTTAANAVSYSNTGLTAGTKYYYRVRAVGVGGNSSYTSTANATTDAATASTSISPLVIVPSKDHSNKFPSSFLQIGR